MRNPLAAVIGGNGFIGRPLVARLLNDGYRVRVVSRSGQSPDPRAQAAIASVADPTALAKAVEGVQVIYSLSTGGGNYWADYERDFVQGARNVAVATQAAGARRLIYVSSIAALYLGAGRTVLDGEPADEQAAKRSYYARAKALAESELLHRHRTHQLPVVIFRPGVVLGPGGQLTHSGLGLWVSDLHCIGWGTGRHPLPFVLAEDVAAALHAAAAVPDIEGLAMNLAGDVSLSAREFLEELRRRSYRLIQFHPRPLAHLWLLDVAKWFVKIAARKAENPFPFYRDFSSRSLRAPIASDLARSHLAWRPNSSRGRFLAQAIDANLPPLLPGDLRLPV